LINRATYNEFEKKSIFQCLAVLLIVLIAAVLRFYKLGEWSFWGDEMFTVGGREDGFNYTFLRQSISLELIQVTVALWGANEWNARLVPALIGIISLPVLYFPIKKIFNPTVSLVALLLLALSPWHLYWSQNARFYVALLLFYTLALLVFYLGLEQDRPLYFLVSLLLLGLAVKERLIALFFVPVILSYLGLLYILPFEKPAGLRWRNLALFFGPPSLILALFFTGPYLLNLGAWFTGFGYANNNPLWLLAGIVYYMGLPLTCAGILGAIYLLFQKSRAGLLLSLGAVIPIIILMAISSFHYTANRYVFICLTSWVILAAVAAVELLRQAQATGKILAFGILIIIILEPLSANILYYRYQNGNRDNWKEALEWVKERKQEGDLVVTINPELTNYYLEDKSVHFQEFDLATVDETKRRVWFVEDMIAQEAYPQLHIWLEQNAQPVANFDVHVQARNFRMRVYFYP
jgi:mannosyltransferase